MHDHFDQRNCRNLDLFEVVGVILPWFLGQYLLQLGIVKPVDLVLFMDWESLDVVFEFKSLFYKLLQ